MGTSKGYIPPTKPEWSNAKRAISSFFTKSGCRFKSKRYSENLVRQ